MLLKNKIAVIYGGGGAIGGATARTFAREGAEIFLAGRTRERLETVAADIRAEGGRVTVDIVDAQDEASVDEHADRVAERAGGIDIAFNAVSVVHRQGLPLAEVSLDEFEHTIGGNTRTNFLTARAVARHMRERGGVILTMTAPGSRVTHPGFLAHGIACSAVETFSRLLAVELGQFGVRVICLRSDAIPDAVPLSYTRELFDGMTRGIGTTTEAWLEVHARDTQLGRLPRLEQIADYAAFVASDRAGAMTGALANLTCGSLLD
ncbi:3-oxoacyl-ACP reductase [Kaistia sp. 32K]|uniref:SDR family NAD(P)-dependent oxidoreductase n=1 Tax=Kaistia sp. 32K TaxID=2795690 RepID=UPI001914FB9E|nr:SDR family oxidoreductase [Kaistia sp. 32K]BCP55774.1 3-oxoacyl-ACP reductase [Kaistia sp. 32K]